MKNSIIEISLACIQNIGGSLCNCICRSDPSFDSYARNVETGPEKGFPTFRRRKEQTLIIGNVASDDACKDACYWMGHKESFCSPIGVTVREL